LICFEHSLLQKYTHDTGIEDAQWSVSASIEAILFFSFREKEAARERERERVKQEGAEKKGITFLVLILCSEEGVWPKLKMVTIFDKSYFGHSLIANVKVEERKKENKS